jgi:transposase
MDNSLSKEATDWREGRRLGAFELKQQGWSQQQIAEALGVSRGAVRGDVWTCERVAEVIRKEFGVSYHPAHVSRLLKALRQSLQKPQRRASQRDEEAIDNWKEQRWPSLKKGRKRKAGP